MKSSIVSSVVGIPMPVQAPQMINLLCTHHHFDDTINNSNNKINASIYGADKAM